MPQLGLPPACTWGMLDCFPRSWSEVEQPELELVPIWDAGMTGGSFAGYAMTLAQDL